MSVLHRAIFLLITLASLQRICAITVEPTAAAPTMRSKANHHSRQLLVNTDPDPSTPPKTTPFDNCLNIGGPDVPHTDPRVAKKGAACDAPNQVHLTLWTPTSVLVSWVTCDAYTGPTVNRARDTPGTTSLLYWRAEWECGDYGSYGYPAMQLGEDADELTTEAEAAKYRRKSHKNQHKKPYKSHKDDDEEAVEHKHKDSSRTKHGKSGSDDYKGNYSPDSDKAYDDQDSDYYKGDSSKDDYYKDGDKHDTSKDDSYKVVKDHQKKHGDDYEEKYDGAYEPEVPSGHGKYGYKDAPRQKDGPSPDYHYDYQYSQHDYTGPTCGKPIRVKGVTTSYYYDYSVLNSTSNNYASGIIHHVLIKDLQPGATYFYKVSGERTSEVFQFKVPAQTFPLTLGVTADPGLTYNTTVVLDRLMAEEPDLVAIIGDFCYADTWKNWTDRLSNADFAFYPNGLTWQPKWDNWGNLWEPLLSRVPMMHVNGNHEIEGELNANLKPNGIRMRSYNARFPLPQTDERRMFGPTSFPPASSTSRWENLYYAVEVPGVFKAIYITSYSFEQPMNANEQQYKWLQAELAKTDRQKTPWLMVNWHSPWYNTYATHYKENDAMRQAYESLLLQYKVDVIFNGHVHAYERKTPIANNNVNKCGPVSITIGDGGNIEGTYKDFIDTVYNLKSYCNPLSPAYGVTWNSYQPQNFTMLELRPEWCSSGTPCFCYTQQVDWSAYREPSFGYGMLTFESATQATWTWHKNQRSRFEIGDQVKITRDGMNSPNCGVVDCKCIAQAPRSP